MKHLLLDVNIILDLWLERQNCRLAEKLIEDAGTVGAMLWFSSSSIPTLKYVFIHALKKEGATENEARGICRKLFEVLFEFARPLTNAGYTQYDLMAKATDIEDAQIAMAMSCLHGEKCIVTHDATFDNLGLVDCLTVADALKWIDKEHLTAKEDSQIPFIDLATQQDTIRPQLEKNIHTVLRHGRYILGPEVQELEKRLCEYTGAKHCVGVSSGTDALLMALMAWKIGPGDAVFTTPFTFIATAEIIQLLGATPVFVDIDPRTFNLDPKKLALAIEAVTKNDPKIHPLPNPAPQASLTPKAIIPVDLFGLPADYDPIMVLAEKYGLKVLSDSAQGFGSEYKGKKSGTLGHATATSFFPAKPLGCYGDGGAIFTDDDTLAVTLESIRTHGKGRDKYDNIRTGLNARLHTLQAAILLAKLEIFPDELAAKQKAADQYTMLFKNRDSALRPPHIPEGMKSAWAQYSLMAESNEQRNVIQAFLKEGGVLSMVYYPKPLHMQTAFSRLGYGKEDFPISVETSTKIFSLPIHGYMQSDVIQKIADIFAESLPLV